MGRNDSSASALGSWPYKELHGRFVRTFLSSALDLDADALSRGYNYVPVLRHDHSQGGIPPTTQRYDLRGLEDSSFFTSRLISFEFLYATYPYRCIFVYLVVLNTSISVVLNLLLLLHYSPPFSSFT